MLKFVGWCYCIIQSWSVLLLLHISSKCTNLIDYSIIVWCFYSGWMNRNKRSLSIQLNMFVFWLVLSGVSGTAAYKDPFLIWVGYPNLDICEFIQRLLSILQFCGDFMAVQITSRMWYAWERSISYLYSTIWYKFSEI